MGIAAKNKGPMGAGNDMSRGEILTSDPGCQERMLRASGPSWVLDVCQSWLMHTTLSEDAMISIPQFLFSALPSCSGFPHAKYGTMLCTSGELNAARSPQMTYVSQATRMMVSNSLPPCHTPSKRTMGLMRITKLSSAGDLVGQRHGVAMERKSRGCLQYWYVNFCNRFGLFTFSRDTLFCWSVPAAWP